MTDRTSSPSRTGLSRFEFTALLSLIMALAALGIDLILPAFGKIRNELGLAPDSTEVAGIVTAYLLGLAVAQVIYGPLSDRFGRRPVLYAGFGIYALAAAAATVAPTLELILISRFVWGVGAAGPRVISLSIVRDTYEGVEMARAMSFIMAIFVMVPILAPSIGAGILQVAPWRFVFGFCVVYVLAIAFWVRRLPETLDPRHRLELRFGRVVDAARMVVTNRQTLGYTLALTALFGVFTSYLASSELIVAETFGRRQQFPLIFGGVAAVMGVGMLANGLIVGRVGLRRWVHTTLLFYVAWAALMVGLSVANQGRPPFWLFFPGLAVMLGTYALLIPNFNTLALDPMGAVAGTASAVIGTTSTAVGAVLGAILDRAFDGGVTPLSLGFLGYGLLALALVAIAERGRLFTG